MPKGIYDRSKAKPRNPDRPIAAGKDLLGDKISTGRRATRTADEAEAQHKEKTSGWAIGVGEANYWWITLEAERRGIDRTAFLKEIISAYRKALPIQGPGGA